MFKLPKMNQSTSIFAAIPKLEDLFCIRCIFSEMQMTSDILKSVKHCQVVCCRDIIRTFPQIIAAPIPSTTKYAYVIMTKKFYETNQLQKLLDFRTIPFCAPQKVTPRIFKMCMKYTIIYKVLPRWNKLDDYLCFGQDFNNPTEELEAIKFDLNIEDECMVLKLIPLKVKVQPLSLEAIVNSHVDLKKFYNNPIGALKLEKQKAFILPGFVKCRLLKVSKEIPETDQFKSYSIIRDHWQHMYGVSLPRKSKSVYYYQASLPKFENRTFTYPGLCLQSSLPKIIECDNPTKIVNLFLEDLNTNITQVCDTKLSFNYLTHRSSKTLVNPTEVEKEVGDSPNSSLVKNPCFANNSKLFSYDPKSLKSLLFQSTVKSPTKSISSNCSSFSFQTTIQTNNSSKCEISGNDSKGEFVKNWLFNSCPSQSSSVEGNSSNSKEEFEKMKDSPSSKFLLGDKPRMRSVETVEVSLSKFKKRKL